MPKIYEWEQNEELFKIAKKKAEEIKQLIIHTRLDEMPEVRLLSIFDESLIKIKNTEK